MISIAFLSDIHANLPALEAVIADMRGQAPDAVYVLGDLINGCPWPVETLALLADAGWPLLLGNHDDAVARLGTPRMPEHYAQRDRFATLWWTRERLDACHVALIDDLPRERTLTRDGLPAVRLVHGVPGNFSIGIRPDSSENWVLSRLEGTEEPVVVAGHTHVPMVRQAGRWLAVNAGAVGVSFDGDCRASYALLRGDGRGWQAEIRRVPYDFDAVSAAFRQTGLLRDTGAIGEVTLRSIRTAQPWLSDFMWWLRDQPAAVAADPRGALGMYDTRHGPGHWAFPYVAP